VRYRALIAVCGDNSKDDEPILRTALFDSAADVRAFAQGQLKRLGFSDVGVSYRSRLANVGHHLLEAIHGLGECGAPEDADWVLPFARHARTTVRAAALRALKRLARDRYFATFADALSDPSARVVRSAHEALIGCPTEVGHARLEALLHDAPTPAGACAALRLLVQQDYWTALEIALRALQHREPTVRAVALAHIERTLRSQTYARPPDLPRLERVARETAGELPLGIERAITNLLEAARRMR
jgi:hypothetical protein